MAKEKKSIPFSTRLTESMDMSINELSDVMMLTKHDIVRIALSEYLLKNKHLIDKNIEYKKDEKVKYDTFELTNINSTSTGDNGRWITGVIWDEDRKEPLDLVELVKIEVNIPIITEKEKIPLLIDLLKNASKEEKMKIEEELIKIAGVEIVEEYTLKYTRDGLAIKNNPKFQQVLEKSVSEIIEEIRNSKK